MKSKVLDMDIELNRVKVPSSERGPVETWGVKTERIQAGSLRLTSPVIRAGGS
jgi:hypothetical protein